MDRIGGGKGTQQAEPCERNCTSANRSDARSVWVHGKSAKAITEYTGNVSAASERQAHLQFQSPIIRRLRKRAHAARDLVRLAEEGRCDISRDRAFIDMVQQIARGDGDGQIVAAIGGHVAHQSTDSATRSARSLRALRVPSCWRCLE